MDRADSTKNKSIYAINSTTLIRKKYFQIYQQSKFLAEKQKEGNISLPTFSSLLCDIFCSLYLPYPTVKHPEEIESNFLINMTILKELLESSFYNRIREKTTFNETASLWMTEMLADDLLFYVSQKKWRREFEKFFKKYAWNNTIDKGKKRKLPFWWFPFSFLKLKTKDSGLRKELKKIDKKIAKIVFRTTHKASKKIENIKNIIEICQGWDINNENINSLSYSVKMGLANQLKNNKRLRDLAKIIGHLRQLAIKIRHSKISDLPHVIYDVILGDDILKIHPSEITFLHHPIFQYDFYQRLASKKIMQYEIKDTGAKGHGTIIVCVDTSRSMYGKPEIMSKGIALGLLEIARVDKRNFIGIIFGQKNRVKTFVFKEEEVEIHALREKARVVKFLDGLLEFVIGFMGGGTDFETPLNTAFSFREKDDIYQDADVVFITDDICNVNREFLQYYNSIKQEKKFNTYGILIGHEFQRPGTLAKFCDEIFNYHTYTDALPATIFEKVSLHHA